MYNRNDFSTVGVVVMSLVFIGMVLCGLAFFFGVKPLYDRYNEQVKISQTKQKLAALDVMLEQYRLSISEYPLVLRELVEGPSDKRLQRRWPSAIASSDDLTDSWGHLFEYILNPSGAQPPYYLLSRGSKGEDVIFSPVSE